MKTDTINSNDQLIPERHPQHDLFFCDATDAILKDIIPQMEHPFYSLSKKPDTQIRRYEHNDHYVEITPSVKGLATIYDKDILIYCISKTIKKIRNGEKVTRNVHINSRELLMFTNRGTAGKDYKALIGAIDRLAGTQISTNIRTGDEEQYKTFSLIDAAEIRRKYGLRGRLLYCEIELSKWVFNAIKANEFLTLHRDYFRLRKPIERRIYELARKHCGHQKIWQIGLEKLLKKTGSKNPIRKFRYTIRELTKQNHLPDYIVEFNSNKDMVIFIKRAEMPDKPKKVTRIDAIRLKPDTYERAAKFAQGWDIHYLEQEWRDWLMKKLPELPRNPDGSFIGFCKKKGPYC